MLNKVSLNYADSLLACKDENTKLAQLILLNEAYDLNLPIIFEPTMSEIDTKIVKKYVKLKK